MIRPLGVALRCMVIVIWLVPGAAVAQTAPEAVAGGTDEPSVSNLWFTVGGVFAAARSDCQTCEEDFPYRRAGGILTNVGYRVSTRMDVGAEVFWMPVDTVQGRVITTHLDAVAQFRPWDSQGFFLKGGAGMAFVRNWVDALGQTAINSKALSVVIGGGWAFRPARRLGLQVFGSQHVAALGDLQTPDEAVPDVVGNFWSFGAAVVIR